MAKSREIKRRIRAVGNIRRITNTMRMIATARFQAAQKRALATRPYAQRIAALVGELAAAAGSEGAGGGLNHPLLRQPAAGRRVGRDLLLVITSNRGLAGAYNGNVLRTAGAFLREHADRQFDLEVVGKKGLAFFRFAGRQVTTFHADFPDQPKYDQVEALADRYIRDFSSGRYDAVHVAYVSFVSVARQTARVIQLLPLEDPAGRAPAASGAASRELANYEFSPDPATLLGELLPITVKTQLFQCFNEAVVSEQIARMVAMKAATDSAGKMGKELNRRYNRARQAAITTELSEIIAGAASLE